MKISTRISIALALGGLTVFGSFWIWQTRNTQAYQQLVFERNTSLLGRCLQVAIDNALRDKQLEDIRETLVTLRAIDASVDISVWKTSEEVFMASDEIPVASDTERELVSLVWSTRLPELRFVEDADPRYLIHGLPIQDLDGSPTAVVVLSRPLTLMEEEQRDTKRSMALSVLVLLATLNIGGYLLGRAYIIGPLERLATAMSGVRSGDLSMVLEKGSNDEMDMMADAFNAMVRDLRQARHDIEEGAERTRRLEKGLREAGKLITIGQLSAGLAHEIGSPLQILNGRARALQSRANDPEAIRRNAEIMVTQTDRITRIVEQLLQFSRRRPPKISTIDLVATASMVVNLLEIEARKRRVDLSLVGEKGVHIVDADEDQVQQIVLNLVTNGLAATSSQGRVMVEVTHGSFKTRDGIEVLCGRLVVSDTGRGIDPVVLPRLGEPFFTTRASEGGTGLGLAVVKAIIDAHRGHLGVDSEVGAGSRFVVDLPAKLRMVQEQKP